MTFACATNAHGHPTECSGQFKKHSSIIIYDPGVVLTGNGVCVQF